jgi:hypothetical protein
VGQWGAGRTTRSAKAQSNQTQAGKMRKLLTPAAVLVALATPAMAFTAAPQDPPLGSGIYLTCKPPLDRSDRDPVVSTMVSVEFVRDTNYHVKSFDVIHSLFSGRTINRNDQYSGTVSKKEKSGITRNMPIMSHAKRSVDVEAKIAGYSLAWKS